MADTPATTPSPTATPAAAPTPPAAPPAPTPQDRAELLAERQKARALQDRVRELETTAKSAAEKAQAAEAATAAKLKAIRERLAGGDVRGAFAEEFDGLKLEDVTAALKKRAKPDPVDETQKEVAALKKRLDEEREQRTKAEAESRAQAVLTHVYSVATATENADKYALVAADMKARPSHYRGALAAYEKAHPTHGPDKCLEAFEAALLQRAKTYVSLPKVRALLSEGVSKTDNAGKPEKPKSSADGPRTLTSTLATERASPKTNTGAAEKDREEKARREKAIAALTVKS